MKRSWFSVLGLPGAAGGLEDLEDLEYLENLDGLENLEKKKNEGTGDGFRAAPDSLIGNQPVGVMLIDLGFVSFCVTATYFWIFFTMIWPPSVVCFMMTSPR